MNSPSQNQQQVWDAIAPEWSKFKTKQSFVTLGFLKKQKGKVLDFGSGSGRYLQKIKNGKMYLIDFSEEMIKLARKKAKKNKIPADFIVADLIKIPFEDNFFDSAIAIASLHCLPKEKHKKAVKEFYRVLKPGAEAQIAVWNKDSKRFKNAPKEKYVGWRDKGKRYYYLFEAKEIYKLFENSGFKITKKLEESPESVNVTFNVKKSKLKKK